MKGTRSVGILATGSYTPERVLTNFDLEKMVETSDEWIVSRTGIRERRICGPEQASSDLALEAAKKALAKANISPEQLDMIIVATVTPDTMFPSTACILQEKLGAKKAAALDVSAACTGFLYGIATGSQFIANGLYRYILVVGVETLSKITNYKDRNTCVLFGDGAGAAVLGPVKEGLGFQAFELGADGSGGALLSQPAGGSRIPASAESIENNLHYISMAGGEVFKFAVRVMNSATEAVLEKSGASKEDIDLLVPHQANKRIIDSAIQRFGLSEDKVAINLDRYGNMSSASIPVALDEAIQEGRLKEGDNVILVGFGGGLTWGATLLKWSTQEAEGGEK
ncbi:beta-ketoacyl-ACP synthase III [Brevibacillus borstelensis]|uniref:beta-ketoacyl-ACP synthase III n=1 Tax=Brevibacillus borstelensis TaxID=45462 RepID=UPI001D0B8A0F|nr:beta-ketoacyl-ACP synthase III [Brevibacillus borstelensis]MCC0564668.1 ketoacyl-ACP synthase III [Brevibacillus borstelensis]MCM3470113.1 ketoacyl-ACP synthase III [Brevibacillus borstelensis]MCM3557777.1 ketoacyl-ACP synthase III [Brevibacillus borstelensis]MCM3620945.1 ketoacyl-ACP synthase III [Brevibacillus borstelensis]MED1852451.1 ketoacyl-ACP synthase III [Brevibacillus borstelensis]